MPTPAKLGIKCNVYYNTATYAAPTWVALTCVSDFTQSVEWDTGEVLTRLSRVKMAVKTTLGLSWNGKLKVGDADTGYQLVLTMLVSDSAMDLLILNGDNVTSGVIGYRVDCQVTSATEDQGTGAVLFDDVKFMPTPTVNAPKSCLVTAGAPVFTSLSF